MRDFHKILVFLAIILTNLKAGAQTDAFLEAKSAFKENSIEKGKALINQYLKHQLAQTGETDTAFSTALHNAGSVFLEYNLKEEALDLFLKEKGIRSGNSEQNTPSAARLDHALGRAYYRVGDFKTAQLHLLISLTVYKKLYGETSQPFFYVLQDLSRLFIEKGNFLLAEKMYEKNLEVSRHIFGKETAEYASCLEGLGLIEEVKGNLSSAETYFHLAEGIITKSKGVFSTEYAYNMLLQGKLYYELGSYTASEALLRKGLHIYHKLNLETAPEAINTVLQLAILNLKLNNNAQAAELLKMVRASKQSYYNEKHPQYAIPVKEIGKLYLQAGYPEVAEVYLNEAKNIFDSVLTSRHFEYLLTLSLLGESHKMKEQFELAEQNYLQTLDTFRVTMGERNAEYGRLQASLGNLYYRMGDYERAIGMHQQCLELRKEILDNLHPDYVESTKDLSLIFWAAGKENRAQAYFKKSIDNYITQYQRYFSFLSEKEKSGFYEGIQEFFRKYNNFAIQRIQKNPKVLGEMYDNIIATKSLLFHTTREMREHIFNADSNLVEKYHRWTRMKEVLAKLYKLEKDELDKRGLALDSLEETANYLEKELSLRVELVSKKGEGHILSSSWHEIRHKLHEEEAAIEILRVAGFSPDSGGTNTDKVFYLALIITKNTKNHPEVVILENGEQLEGRYLNFYRNAIKLNVPDKITYNQFWKPIIESEALKGIKRIYFSPDGVYNQISLNTLFNPDQQQYVVDQTDIHMVTTTRDIHEIKRLKGNQEREHLSAPMFMAYPDYDKENSHELTDAARQRGLERGEGGLHVRGGISEAFRGGHIVDLPGTKVEVETISELFREKNQEVEISMGMEATEEKLKDDKHFHNPPRIIHIATHGFFMEDQKPEISLSPAADRATNIDSVILSSSHENPLLRSGILLTGAANAYTDETLLEDIYSVMNGKEHEDGILTAYEAMNLNLNNVELVVLSACETHLGKVKNGEGVYGLQRAFQTAGANTVIMSLWKVNDEATQKFMVEFYKEYLRSNDKRKAFQHAQKQIRKDFPEPKYWGAFVMIGE